MIKLSKTILLLIAGCFLAMPAFSQNTQKAAAKPALSPDKSKMLCKAWQLDTVSEFGVDNKATAKEANDGITLVADGSLFITQEGVAATGKWSYMAGRINTVTTNPDKKMSLKIISLTDGRLVLEYQAEDLTRTQYTYYPKKQ